METQDRYDAFLSYASQPDRGVARNLEAWLEKLHEVAPADRRKAPLRICRDGSDFKLSEEHPQRTGETQVQATLRHYLSRCERLIVLCSSGATTSAHVDDEVRIFLESGSDGGLGADGVILAVTEGHDPTAVPEEVFPPRILGLGLHERLWVDLRDLSWRRRHNAKAVRDFDEERLTLAARLYEESVDAISPFWYRDQRRRKQRQLTVLGFVLAVVISLAAGLFFFWRSAVASERRTQDTLRMTLVERHQIEDLDLSAAYLLDVKEPSQTPRWTELVQEHLRAPIADAIWRHDNLGLVGSLQRYGRLVMAYGLLGTWHLFPSEVLPGCAVGFPGGDPIGTPMVSASGEVAFVDKPPNLFRFSMSCAPGDHGGAVFEEPRRLVGLWGNLPILAESADQFIVALPGERASYGLSWHLPFECFPVGVPLVQEGQVLVPCEAGRAVVLSAGGALHTLDGPPACRGEWTGWSAYDSGVLFAVGSEVCRVSAEPPSIVKVQRFDEPIVELATNPDGTVAAAIETSGTTHRLWFEPYRLEAVRPEATPSIVAISADGMLATLSRGRLEWFSPDGRLRGSRSLPDTYVHDATFLADGRLVVGLDDDTLRVWEEGTLRRSLQVQAGQLIHLKTGADGATALYQVNDRLGLLNWKEGTFEYLPTGRDWGEFTERTGWLTGSCGRGDHGRCWFDAFGNEDPVVPLGRGVDYVDAADLDPGLQWLGWYSGGRVYLADLTSLRTFSADLPMPEGTFRVEMRVLDGARLAVLFSDPMATPPVAWLVRAKLSGERIVTTTVRSRPGTAAIARLQEEPNILCELRRDGWTACDDAALQFRMPDIVVTTPAASRSIRAEREPVGIRRLDDRRIVVWSSDAACIFYVGEPDRCDALGFAGTPVQSVEPIGDFAVLGTYSGMVMVYDLHQAGSGLLVPITAWKVGESVEQMRQVDDRITVATPSGVIDLQLTAAGLREQLSRREGLCVSPGRRTLELGEEPEVAEQHYRDCLDRTGGRPGGVR